MFAFDGLEVTDAALQHGNEAGDGAKPTFATFILSLEIAISMGLTRLHPLGGIVKANALNRWGASAKVGTTGGERSGGQAGSRGRDFGRRLGGKFELQALQQEQVIVLGLGVARKDDGPVVGRGQFDIDHLDSGELFEHGSGGQPRRQRLQPLLQHDHQAVGQERHEYMGLDAGLQLVMDGTNRKIVLQFLERLLDLDQLQIEPPQMARSSPVMLERKR